jgi:hypothetical protein
VLTNHTIDPNPNQLSSTMQPCYSQFILGFGRTT